MTIHPFARYPSSRVFQAPRLGFKLSKDLVNKLSYAHDRSSFAFNLDPASDTFNLLDWLLKTEA